MNQNLRTSGKHLSAVNKLNGGGIVKLCLSLLLMLVTITASAQLKGSGTEDDPYLIGSVDDWYALMDSLRSEKSVNVKMTADIGPLNNLTSGYYTIEGFSGVFDGQGHTLTVEGYNPPFWDIYPGTTIKNLHIAGTLITDGTRVGGIAKEATLNHKDLSDSRPCNFYNCRSSVIITLAYEGRQRSNRVGGFIGNSAILINFENCLFDGAIKQEAPTPQDRAKAIGGLVGNTNGVPISIKNTFMAGKIQNASSQRYDEPASASFVYPSDNVTVENSYWIEDYVDEIKDSFFISQGTAIKSDDARLKSGELAYLLQGDQTDSLHWGQTIGTDSLPVQTSNNNRRVIANVYDDSTKVYDNFVVINEDKGNKSNIAANASFTGNVKLVRKFADDWNTLVLPFELSTDEVNEAFGDDTKIAYFTNEELNIIELNTNADGTKDIAANTPVLIKPSKPVNEIGDLTFSNKTIAAADEAIATGENGISFVGSYDANYTVKEGDYFISGTNLWKSNGNSTLKATRGYFAVPETAAGTKIMLYINDSDNSTTGISSIRKNESGDRSYNSAVYAISGQKVADSINDARISSLKQGVYIMNGKKVIIK